MKAQHQTVQIDGSVASNNEDALHGVSAGGSVEQRLVDSFKTLYQRLNAETIGSGLIESVYDENMHFEDSFHQIDGREAFVAYCESLYENVQQIDFVFHEQWIKPGQAMLTWTMTYRHPRLKRGKDIAVQGASHLRFDDKITFHQDFFDGGQLLYEQIPVLGTLIQGLKKRMA